MTPEVPTEQFERVLHNFSLAENIARHLDDHVRRGEQVPAIRIMMTSRLGTVVVPGEACGLFTTPVIHQACIDVRKTLTFVNLRYGYNAKAIERHVDTRHDDNWNIEDLGLASVTPEELVAMSERLFGSRPERFILDMIHYVDKQLAHFTRTEHRPDFESIERSSILMTEVVLVHIYDALGVPRPHIPLRDKES